MLVSTKRILFLLALMVPLTGAAQTIPATPPGYSFCSGENRACSFTGPLDVAYGAKGSFVFRTLTNGTTCDNGSFGEDPAVLAHRYALSLDIDTLVLGVKNREELAGCAHVRRILIHINNTNPILIEGSPEEAKIKAAGWEVAFDGMEVSP